MQVNRKRWFAAHVPVLLGPGYLAVQPATDLRHFRLWRHRFDPTSYAQFGEIWGQDISNGAKLARPYNQTVKIVKNGFKATTSACRWRSGCKTRKCWKTAAFCRRERSHAESLQRDHQFQRRDERRRSACGQGLAAEHPIRRTVVPRQCDRSEQPRMSEFATLQLLDQTSQRCATILANYKETQDANQQPEDKLHSDAFDETDAKNPWWRSERLVRRAHSIADAERANGNLQACLAEQQTLEAKLKRDNWLTSRTGTPTGRRTCQFPGVARSRSDGRLSTADSSSPRRDMTRPFN